MELVGPARVAELLGGEVHPAYELLSLVHRADYLRAELLHRYGGWYADVDTLCWGDLAGPTRLLADAGGRSAVLYDFGLLHEAGMNVGLFRRGSLLTRSWVRGLRARLRGSKKGPLRS